MNLFDRIISFFRRLFNAKEVTSQPRQNRNIQDKISVEHSKKETTNPTIYQEKEDIQIQQQESYDNEIVSEEESSIEKNSIKYDTPESLTKDDLFIYLENAESYSIHYNKGENGKTAPLGVYYKYFQYWEGWRFLTQIAQECDIDFNPSTSNDIGCKALTKVVTTNYRGKMDDLLYAFIEEEYIQKLHLDYFPGKKSALSYFSITVNGGKYRSARILQKVLNENGEKLKIDGKAGEKTYDALLQSGLDDEYLNQQILLKVYNFYNYLLSRNPAKYSQYYDGWINRLESLGFKEPKE